MNKKEYTSPKTCVVKEVVSFNLMADVSPTRLTFDTESKDATIRSKGIDGWDDDESDDFGW